MAMWLYQLSQKDWSLNNYRLDIWEGERWEWEVGQVSGQQVPQPGDTGLLPKNWSMWYESL